MVENPSSSAVSRREFLRRVTALGGAAALAAAIQACSVRGIETQVLNSATGVPGSPASVLEIAPTTKVTPSATATAGEATPSPTPTVTPDDGTARVAFVKTNNRAEGVRQAIALLGINPVFGKSVFLKPNFNSSDPAPGSTHPDVLTSLVTTLKEMGASNIAVGDRSGMGNTRQVMEQLGIFQLSNELGFDVTVFDELTAEEWVLIQPAAGHWQNGFWFARPCFEADALVQTCCLKTHQYGGHFTLSLKNSVGMAAQRYPGENYDYMQELHSSSHQRRMIAEINTAYTPALVLLDGVEAFKSGGPHAGGRVTPEVILAGTDRIAIDAAGVALLRYFGCQTEAARGKIFEQEQIARAVELGLGVDRPEKIEFLTGDADSKDYSEIIKEVLTAG